MPPAKPKLAQEDWDEAVRTNLEDFDMTPEEAVEAAAEEFAARYDLSGVVRAGAAAAAAHPAALAAAALRAALGEEQQEAPRDRGAVKAAVAALATACFPPELEDRQPALAVAAKEGAAALLLRAAADDANADSSPDLSLPALRLLRRLLLRSADARAAFLQARGVERCTDWLAQSLGAAPAAADSQGASCRSSSSCWPAAALVAAVCEAACLKSEEAKCRFASYVPPAGPLAVARPAPAAPCPHEEQPGAVGAGGFVSLLLGRVLASPEAPPAAIAAAAGVLRSLTYADDESALASRAFTHARLLAKTHGALRDLLFALQRLSSAAADASEEEGKEEENEAAVAGGGAKSDDGDADADALPSTRVEAVAAVLAAVRAVAANDDACRGFSDDGGVRACLRLLRRAVEQANAADGGGGVGAGAGANASAAASSSAAAPTALARSAAGALRQLANSDPVKEQLAGDGALDVIVGAIGRFSGGGGGGGKGGKGAAGADAEGDDEEDGGDQSPRAAAEAASAAPEALEPVAGLLAAMTLRQPEVSSAAAAAGAVEALCAALGRLLAAAAAAAAAQAPAAAAAAAAAAPPSAAPACRQLCLAVRNMACRGGEGVRASFLEAGAEPLLRAAKRQHPASCRDVASAALRDLGLDNYNA